MHKRTTTLHAIGPQALLSSSLGFVFVSRLFHIDDEVWQSRISHIDDVLTILTRNDVSTDTSCYGCNAGWLEVGRNTISTSTEATGLFHSPIVLNNTLSNSFHSEDSDPPATTGIFLADEIVPPSKEKEAEQQEKLLEWTIDTKDCWCDEPSSSIDSHREIEWVLSVMDEFQDCIMTQSLKAIMSKCKSFPILNNQSINPSHRQTKTFLIHSDSQQEIHTHCITNQFFSINDGGEK